MEIVPIQYVFKRKFERQEQIKKVKYHAAGYCVHVGKLSPGCYSCFVPDPHRKNFVFGSRCDANCVYCTSRKKEKDLTRTQIQQIKYNVLRESTSVVFSPSSISFSGGGEPLLYLDIIDEFMVFYRGLEKYMSKKPWYYLYTNGILATNDVLLRLKDLGFDEIRFHLGASNFSNHVYAKMKKAVRYFKAITVETPAWPLHRKKLFEMLPIIKDIGIKHLNLGEIEINIFNYDRIASALPDGKVYHAFEMHLYDGGLTYDIIEEIIKKKYSYSVLDCSCFVKMMQRGHAKNIRHCDVTGLCVEY
jgi:pyruvate formate-lyase activating enzyme-like uncharacterized protein